MKYSELDSILTRFIDINRAKYGDHAYTAGYLSSLVCQIGEENPEAGEYIARQIRSYNRNNSKVIA